MQDAYCVHLALSKIEGLYSNVDSLSPGYAMYLKHLFQNAGLDIAVLGNYLNLAHPDSDTLKAIQQKYVAHLRFASHLGCSVVGTETGAPNSTYSYDKEACHSDWALDLFIENLKIYLKRKKPCFSISFFRFLSVLSSLTISMKELY